MSAKTKMVNKVDRADWFGVKDRRGGKEGWIEAVFWGEKGECRGIANKFLTLRRPI
jgi:hypothetical protein